MFPAAVLVSFACDRVRCDVSCVKCKSAKVMQKQERKGERGAPKVPLRRHDDSDSSDKPCARALQSRKCFFAMLHDSYSRPT